LFSRPLIPRLISGESNRDQAFRVHALPDEEVHLCPVQAISEWIHASQITSGYLFRRMASGDRPSAGNTPMVRTISFNHIDSFLMQGFLQTSEQFLETFRNNLLDVGIDPSPYGTHSFRHGSCQYLSSEHRWTLQRICDWGGWSTEFLSMTIVKYLISWNDDLTESRDDFFNPNRVPTVKCPYCRHSCHCA